MKTNIYLIRHAQSIANAEGLFGGLTDYNLSNYGLKQADKLALKLKDVNVDKIYSSPLKRAIQTITPTARMMNKKVNIVDDLREIYLGKWENRLISELKSSYPIETNYIEKTEYYTGIEEQEKVSNVAKRMISSIRKIALENCNSNVIITSHSVAIKAFLCSTMNIPFEQTKEKTVYLDNTSIVNLVFDNVKCKFEITQN